MQRTIYQCDNCEKEIGRKKHISLILSNGGGYRGNNACGIAIPPPGEKGGGAWKVSGFQNNFIHFCNGKCIGAFFSKLMKSSKDQKK